MKRSIVFAALLAIAGCKSGGDSKPQPKTTTAAPAAERVVEGHGQVIKAPMEGAGNVAFKILFYAGSIDDPAGKEGLTKLTAQTLLEGGSGERSYAEILNTLYPWAAHLSVSVDKEQSVFSGTVHPDHAVAFAEILAGVLTSPRFDADAFARVKRNLQNDIDKRLKAVDDENLGKALLESMIYPKGHPLHHFRGGTREGLAAATLEEAKVHARSVFGRRRMLIGLGGDITPEIEAAMVDALANLHDGAPRSLVIPKVATPTVTQVLIAHKPSSSAVAVSMGFAHDAHRGHNDWPAMAWTASHLGEHRQFHGVMMAQLRGLRGLNYGDYTYSEAFRQAPGSRFPMTNVSRRQQHFEVWIRPVDPTDSGFSIRLAHLYLQRFLAAPPSDERVRSIDQFLQGYTRLWSMTSARRLGYALDDHFYGTKDYLQSLRTSLTKLNGASVHEATKRHLQVAPKYIAIVAADPEQVIEGLVAPLKEKKKYPVEKTPELLADDEEASKLDLGVERKNVKIVPVEELFVR